MSTLTPERAVASAQQEAKRPTPREIRQMVIQRVERELLDDQTWHQD